MPAPILATKLYIPLPQPKAVSRPRLLERLNNGLHRKLTLISAAAGFGKTTLASEWVAGPGHRPPGQVCERPVAWLSLDEGDNDPPRFLKYLVAALQTIAANIGKGVLVALQSPQPPPIESILITLLNEITTIPDNFVFVLDDYHVIDSEAIDQALAFLLDHLPPQMHLVITTREDPHLPLARLRARGQLTELRAADLRFTPAEASDFLNQVMGLNLSSEDITALEARTEGWIAGLQMAAISMQGHQDAASFIQSFTGSHHFVLDYLIEEVLQQQSESVQAFLLRTSILNRLCGPLCDAVLGSPSASGQETLEYLERANLFIIPLDNERYWYRYHHLFGDLLRQRLGQRLSPEEIAEYHIHASLWYEMNNDDAEAFHHAYVAGDFDRAGELAELTWRGMDDNFQSGSWLGWVKMLPDEVIRVRPILGVQVAQALTDAGELEASEARLRDAERWLDGSQDGIVVVDKGQLGSLPAMIALTHATNAQIQGNLSATVKYAELALQLIPEDDLFKRAQATLALEFTHWASGDLEAAYRAMLDWMNSMEKVGNIPFVVASAFAVADILIEQGRLRQAFKTYQQALQLAAEHGKDAQQITAHHYLGLAMLSHEMGDAEAAIQHLQKARELGEQTTLIDWPYRWHLAQARLKQDGGDLEAALTLLDEARRVFVRNPVPDTRPIETLKARLYLRQGYLAKALDWARERKLSVDDDLSYLSEFEHITYARVLIAEYQCSRTERTILQVLRLLDRLLKLAEGQRRMGSVIEILVTQVLAHQAQGNLPLAFMVLERTLTLAEPEGYVRIFVDEGEPMRSLISDFLSQIEKQSGGQSHQLQGYLNRLLDAFSRSVALPQATISNLKSSMIEPLSQREVKILQLIAQGLSNREICERLFLALSTVKGYNRIIFDKLQVQSRTEAVARARDLGLL
jgi:LuxR family maltose regulon positive regulatory protein